MNTNNNEIVVRVPFGIIRATKSNNPDFPGIDIEFIADDDMGENLSRPRITMEYEKDSKDLRALAWSNKNHEEYTQEIIFANWKGGGKHEK